MYVSITYGMTDPDSGEKRIFAFDFDGVLAHRIPSYDPTQAGDPNYNVVEAIKTLKKDGHTIIIHSTRESTFLQEYCERHEIPADYYNENPERPAGNMGKPIASVYIDDRAHNYSWQEADTLVKELLAFEPYYRKAEKPE